MRPLTFIFLLLMIKIYVFTDFDILATGKNLVNELKSIHRVFICDAQFKDATYDNKHAGSAFFLRKNGQVYGVTAKHVLFFAKTDNMNSVDFGNELKQWNFVSKEDSTFRIKMGALVNANPNEVLNEKIVGDWLIFKVDQPLPEEVFIYDLAMREPNEGEPLFFEGVPYNSKRLKKPLKVKGSFEKEIDSYSFSMNVPNANYAGCSGGPVTNEKGRVVGLVSMGYYDKKQNKHIFQPASISYFEEIIKNTK